MKVLHINCNYLGTTLHQNMIEQLDCLGVSNQVFVPTCSSQNTVIKPNKNICVAQCFQEWDRLSFYYKQRKIFRCIQEKINIKDFDCIHAYTLFTDGNCAMELSKKYGVPYVVAVRNTDVNSFLKYMIHLRGRAIQIMRGASAIFFLSESYQQLVISKYVPSEYKDEILNKSYVIPNGIDNFWLKHVFTGLKSDSVNRIKNKEVHAIFVGKINKRKNVVTTQKALKLIRGQGWKTFFTVVGKICDNSVYEAVIKYPETTYIEQQPPEKLIELYRDNDIFVMPSNTETFGLVYAEAISQGLPVIYTKGQGFDGQFPEGEVGFHVDATSADSVADGILALADNYENIIQNLSEKANKFSWSTICQSYMKIYNEIIDTQV